MRWKLPGSNAGGALGIPGGGVKSADIGKNTEGEGMGLA